MYNRLSQCKFFSFADKSRGIGKTIMTTKYSDYVVPVKLYNDRISAFNTYKVPFVKEVIDYVRSGKIVLTNLTEGSDPKKIGKDLHVTDDYPCSVFNITQMDNASGNIISLCDISYKGKYSRDPDTGLVNYLDISDTHLFYMMLSAYLNLRIVEDMKITEHATFYETVATLYSLIMSKIIDNMVPIEASTNVDLNKLFFITNVFCLQNMFLLPKEDAIKHALKMRQINDKDSVMNESVYINSTDDFIGQADYDKVFPIDIFCAVLSKEYPELIDSRKFNPATILMQFNKRFGKNGTFAIEHLGSFINFLTFSRGKLSIFNDFFTKQYLETGKDFLKEIYPVVK